MVVWFGPAQVPGRLACSWASGAGVARAAGPDGAAAACRLSLAIFALADHTLALLLFALLFGLANGLVTIVRGSLVPEYFGREHVGRISGAMCGIALLSRAAAPLVTAWMLLALPGYREVLLVLAGLGAVAVVAFALARPPQRQRCVEPSQWRLRPCVADCRPCEVTGCRSPRHGR